MLLQRQKQQFSGEFYQRHRQHVLRVIRKGVLYFILSGTFATLFLLACFYGKGTTLEAGIAVAIFLWICFGICVGIPDSLRVRLLPYFERPLGNISTWDHGRSLLNHSRELDELATGLGVTPLSRFASGDDLIPGEQLVWHEPQLALEAVTRLLESKAARDFPKELASDLAHLRDALSAASTQQVRFCFLLREGSSASDAEMTRRKGSFF
ncbi:MAG: hypothetical protein ACTHKU_08950 [Verrucomicrobiota bacterium]